MHTLIAFFCLISVSLTANVKWIPNTNFNLPLNFKDGKIPCSKQSVIFPDVLNGFININSEIAVDSLVLPLDGEFVLSDGSIELGATDDNCTNSGNVYFLEKSVSSWAQPDVWSSPMFNKATPDAERIPCFDDVVEFPENSVFTVSLPEINQVVRSIRIGGETFDSTSFADFVSGSEKFIMNQEQETGVIVKYKQCQSRSGCPCQENYLTIDCAAKFCHVPTCVDPIEPLGHCCKICGGVINFKVDQSFDIMTFRELVDNVVESYGKDDLDYHIGKIGEKIQLVVTNKGEYSETSALVVNDIDRRMEKHWVQGIKEAVISGTPLTKYGMSGKIFISMFFTVVMIFGAIYLYYYKFPEVRIPVLGGPLLSRYGRTDSVVSLTRRDSVMTTRSGISTAFRNPMYNSKRERVVVAETSDDQ
ncbi:protein amnionless [Pieris brassicae]|uniref:protein amnionless n=1 Tax=Pieris brassicae TaxID=7116 RepID=UPI001E6623A0|nr:protein amnionless [Pieris brassicae]